MIKAVDGKDKSLRDLLSNTQYSIDFYQREYRWQTKQVHELLDDLTSKFLAAYKPEHGRSEVANYPAYFLGSIILSRTETQNFIIDGQQRLTTLTLLLVFLRNLQTESGNGYEPLLEPLILSTHFGQRKLNIYVEERAAMMEALFANEPLPAAADDSSIAVLRDRYEDIVEHFDVDCRGEALPYFLDWLLARLQLVEISAYSDEDAYTIFETMNDRGLSLSPSDMLKGLILSNIRDEAKRALANQNWKQYVSKLAELGKDVDNDFFRVWFRGQLGETVGTSSDDYDRLGPEFHRWLRENASKVGLIHSDDYEIFANESLPFFSTQYKRMRTAEDGTDLPVRTIHLNSFGIAKLDTKFVLIAPLMRTDTEVETTAKLAITADYLDIFMMRRLWESKNLTAPALKGTLAPLARKIRDMDVNTLASHLLADLLKPAHADFDSPPPTLVSWNRTKLHRLLARLSDYLEANAGASSERFKDFMVTSGHNKFSIEHLLSNTLDFAANDFETKAEFEEWREKLGALVLLPQTFNASYQDEDWRRKFPKYARSGHNLLAASLTPSTYLNNPRFNRFISSTGISFRPYEGSSDLFGKTEIDERTDVYRNLAKEVWNPRRLLNSELVDAGRVRELTIADLELSGVALDPSLRDPSTQFLWE